VSARAGALANVDEWASCVCDRACKHVHVPIAFRRLLLAVFRAWIQWLAGVKQENSRVLRVTFRFWAVKSSARRDVGAMLRRADTQWPARAIASAFAHLRALTNEKMTMRSLDARADALRRQYNLTAAVRLWRERARVFAVMRPALMRVVRPVRCLLSLCCDGLFNSSCFCMTYSFFRVL
jgi:hypothetical protein